MGGASADREFTGKEKRKAHKIGTAIRFAKGKGMFLLSVIARELLWLCMGCSYYLGSAIPLWVVND